MAAMISLVRHGQSLWQTGDTRSHDAELSPLGHLQCLHLSSARITGDVVLTSPLARARQTARYLERAELPPVKVSETLREAAFHIGSEDGTRSKAPPTARYLSFWRGVQDTMKQLEDKHLGAGRSVVAITHNGFIKCVLRKTIGDPDMAIKVANCSVTNLRWDGEWSVTDVGAHTHVPATLLTY